MWLATLVPADKVSDLRISAEDGRLRASGRYKFGFVNIPVDLAISVVGVSAESLDLSVGAGAGGDASFVSDVLLGLLAGGRVTGVRVLGCTIHVDVRALTQSLGVPFRLQGLRITPAGITLGVSDLLLPEPPAHAKAGALRPGSVR